MYGSRAIAATAVRCIELMQGGNCRLQGNGNFKKALFRTSWRGCAITRRTGASIANSIKGVKLVLKSDGDRLQGEW